MPKVKFLDRSPETQKRLADELKKQYGGALTLVDVMDAIGVKSHHTAKAWITSEKIDAVVINGKKKWRASDIARALDNSKIRGAAD